MKINNLDKQYNSIANLFEKETSLKDNNHISKYDFYKTLEGSLKDKKVLDVGCGDGTDMIHYKSEGANIFGVDSSEEFVKLSQNKIGKEEIKLGYFDSIPFEDNTFDVVLSKYALQTTEDVTPFFKEAFRILKEKGYLVFLVAHPFRQYMEKKKGFKNYFEREIVDSNLFNNTMTVKEPTHTMQDYLSKDFLNLFEILEFKENYDFPAAECVDGNIYPTYFIIKARKK